MDHLWQDLRYALRALRRRPSVTVLATGSLALAIAGNATVFSLINGLLYRPLPYHEPHRIALIGERAEDAPRGQIAAASAANFLDWQERPPLLAPSVVDQDAAHRRRQHQPAWAR